MTPEEPKLPSKPFRDIPVGGLIDSLRSSVAEAISLARKAERERAQFQVERDHHAAEVQKLRDSLRAVENGNLILQDERKAAYALLKAEQSAREAEKLTLLKVADELREENEKIARFKSRERDEWRKIADQAIEQSGRNKAAADSAIRERDEARRQRDESLQAMSDDRANVIRENQKLQSELSALKAAQPAGQLWGLYDYEASGWYGAMGGDSIIAFRTQDAANEFLKARPGITGLTKRPLSPPPDSEWELVGKAIRAMDFGDRLIFGLSVGSNGNYQAMFRRGDDGVYSIRGRMHCAATPQAAIIAAACAAGLLPSETPAKYGLRWMDDESKWLLTPSGKIASFDNADLAENYRSERSDSNGWECKPLPSETPKEPHPVPHPIAPPEGYTLPEGFEYRGEMRLPQKGEWYIDGPPSLKTEPVMALQGFNSIHCPIIYKLPAKEQPPVAERIPAAADNGTVETLDRNIDDMEKKYAAKHPQSAVREDPEVPALSPALLLIAAERERQIANGYEESVRDFVAYARSALGQASIDVPADSRLILAASWIVAEIERRQRLQSASPPEQEKAPLSLLEAAKAYRDLIGYVAVPTPELIAFRAAIAQEEGKQ